MVRKSCIASVLLIAIYMAVPETAFGFPADWSDLDEGEHAVFGSEKEKKYSINAFFVERERWDNHSAFMFFWLYKYTDYPKYSSLRAVPFWYRLESKIDARTKTVIPILGYYRRYDGVETRIISPLYYSRYGPRERERSILYLTWWGGAETRNSRSSYFFTPLLYGSRHASDEPYRREYLYISPVAYWRSEKHTSQESNSLCTTNLSLLHYYSSSYRNNALSERTWWAPIVPLTYHHTSPAGGHRNILWLMDYSWDIADGGDVLKRFWLFPLWMWKPGPDGYNHIMIPLYISSRWGDGGYYRHVLPVFGAWRGTESEYSYSDKKWETVYSEGVITPMYCSIKHRTGDRKWEGSVARSSSWMPLIPLYYSHTDAAAGTHRNLFWLLDWSGDASGRMTRLWVLPVYLASDAGYRHILPPVYMNWKNDDASSHTNMMLLFDWKRDAEGSLDRFWCIPLLFHKTGEWGYRWYIPFYMRPAGATDERGLSFGMFHYHRWEPGEEVKWSYLIHYNREAPAKDERVNHWMPLYFDWQYGHKSLTLFMPLYFDYKDGAKALHVNILGISKSVASGPSPNIMMGMGKQEGGWYVDTEVSWLYDVASLATRVTISKTAAADAHGNARGLPSDDIARADAAEKKVALLEKKTVSRDTSRYFWGFKLLFGLTAFEAADSRRHFRLLPLSWITWDKTSDDEITWIVNYMSYRSEDVEYFVFFPLYGSQRNGGSFKRGYLLNLYWDEYYADSMLRERTIFWPMVNFYSSPSKSGWRIFPVVWHAARNGGEYRTTRTVTPLWYGKSRSRIADSTTTDSFSISPLHLYSVSETADERTRIWFAPILPVIFCSSYRDTRPSGDSFGSGSRFFVLPLYYRSIFSQESAAGRDTAKVSRETTSVSWLWFHRTRSHSEGNDAMLWAPVLPLVYYRSKPDYLHVNVLGLFDRMINRGDGASRLWLLPLYYAYRSKTENSSFYFGVYLASDEQYRRQNVLLLYDHREYSAAGRNAYSCLLGSMSYEISPEVKQIRLVYGLLLGYDGYMKRGDYDFSLLWFIYNQRRFGDTYRQSLFPLWYYASDGNGWSLLLPPLLSYVSDAGANGSYQAWALGALWYRNRKPLERYDRQMLLLGIPYYHIHKRERGYESTGSFWGLLWEYETESETNFTKFSLLKLLYKRVDMNGEVYHQVLGIRL